MKTANSPVRVNETGGCVSVSNIGAALEEQEANCEKANRTSDKSKETKEPPNFAVFCLAGYINHGTDHELKEYFKEEAHHEVVHIDFAL